MKILTGLMFLLTAWASWHHISVLTVLWVIAIPGLPYLFVKEPRSTGRTLVRVTKIAVWINVVIQILLIIAIQNRR